MGFWYTKMFVILVVLYSLYTLAAIISHHFRTDIHAFQTSPYTCIASHRINNSCILSPFPFVQ